MIEGISEQKEVDDLFINLLSKDFTKLEVDMVDLAHDPDYDYDSETIVGLLSVARHAFSLGAQAMFNKMKEVKSKNFEELTPLDKKASSLEAQSIFDKKVKERKEGNEDNK